MLLLVFAFANLFCSLRRGPGYGTIDIPFLQRKGLTTDPTPQPSHLKSKMMSRACTRIVRPVKARMQGTQARLVRYSVLKQHYNTGTHRQAQGHITQRTVEMAELQGAAAVAEVMLNFCSRVHCRSRWYDKLPRSTGQGLILRPRLRSSVL